MKKCRKGQLSTCHAMCDSKIAKILVKLLKLNDEFRHIQALEMGAFTYFRNSQFIISKRFIPELIKNGRILLYNPGIYLGAMRLQNGNLRHIWSKHISIDPSDRRLVYTREEAIELIDFICRKYNLFGSETGTEISPEEIPTDSVCYEEIVT